MMTETEINLLSGEILDASISVHREMGPGLLESVYEECLCYELLSRNVKVDRQVFIPIKYKQKVLDANLRLDLLIEDTIIVELKSVEKIMPIHQAQIMTYLKLSNKSIGLLINFNEKLLKNGFKRYRI
jgi:GxxExxY protein